MSLPTVALPDPAHSAWCDWAWNCDMLGVFWYKEAFVCKRQQSRKLLWSISSYMYFPFFFSYFCISGLSTGRGERKFNRQWRQRNARQTNSVGLELSRDPFSLSQHDEYVRQLRVHVSCFEPYRKTHRRSEKIKNKKNSLWFLKFSIQQLQSPQPEKWSHC